MQLYLEPKINNQLFTETFGFLFYQDKENTRTYALREIGQPKIYLLDLTSQYPLCRRTKEFPWSRALDPFFVLTDLTICKTTKNRCGKLVKESYPIFFPAWWYIRLSLVRFKSRDIKNNFLQIMQLETAERNATKNLM